MAEGTALVRTEEEYIDADIIGAGGKMYVKVSETYDLSTKPDRMGFLGIHTPDGKLVYSMWKGFFQNFGKMRFATCDVTMACASMLPADPLQIGVEAGDIAPQDMFNPILYKAVSNDSMSMLLNKIYAGGQTSESGTVLSKNSIFSQNEPVFNFDSTREVDQFAMYYGLLSDSDGWKKAMPQAGLEMRSLIPLTFSLVATQGQPNVVGNLGLTGAWFPGDGFGGENDDRITSLVNHIGRYMRGDTRRMPSVDTMVLTTDGVAHNTIAGGVVSADTSGNYPEVGDTTTMPIDPGVETYNTLVVPNLDVPNCFVAAIVLPPAKLNRLYYRLKVTWTIEFSFPRPLTNLTNWYGLANVGVMSYGSDYETQTALITKGDGKAAQAMVDAGDMEITKVMEGSK